MSGGLSSSGHTVIIFFSKNLMKERSTKQRKANLFGRPKLPHVFGLKYDEKLAFSFVKCRLEYS